MVTLHKVEKANIATEMPQHLNSADELILKTLIENHCQYTESNIAKKILNQWDIELGNFIKVMPIEYKRALIEMKEAKAKEVA
jgi:glutamate synthase (NADPH/NADH) large chain